MNALLGDENLLEERELLIVIVHFTLDERSNLLARALTRGNIRQIVDDRWYLLVDAFFDKGNSFRRKGFGERRIAARYTAVLQDLPGIAVMQEATWASSVFWMYTRVRSSKSSRIASFVDVSSWNPVDGSSAGSARSSVVIGSLRLRSMRA